MGVSTSSVLTILSALRIATAAQFQSASTLNVTGSVNPDISRTIPVVSLASGRVVALHARVGDNVRKGQLLMEVESTDISGAFDQYLKAVNDERLATRRTSGPRSSMTKARSPKASWRLPMTGSRMRKADLTAAEQQLHVLGVDKDHPSATIKVYSPATGVIIAQNVTDSAVAGVAYSGSSTAFTIADLSHVWIVCDVYENDLPSVRLGQTADIRLNAYPNRVFTGAISEIDAVLDPSIRAAKVRIQVNNPDGIMRVGMFATATFHGKRLETHVSVPATAILHLHDRDWVYVPAEGGKFRRVGVVGGAMLPGNMQEATPASLPDKKSSRMRWNCRMRWTSNDSGSG